MMNSVHNLPTNLPTELPTEFGMSVIPLVKMIRHHFFLLCFNLFSHGNSLGISVCIYQFSGSERNNQESEGTSLVPFMFLLF
jgi:hypothetical protein